MNGTKYFLNLRMFGSLIAEESDHSNKGRELQIYLKKSAKCNYIFNANSYNLNVIMMQLNLINYNVLFVLDSSRMVQIAIREQEESLDQSRS